MFIVLTIMLSAAALLAVAYPILMRTTATKPATTSQETLDELFAQRDAALQALRELNFDRRIGKISDEDFVAFEAGLKHNAAEAFRALDQWESQVDAELDHGLEREMAARKALLVAADRPCPACGQPTATDDKFCAACGAALAPAPAAVGKQAACPKCGRRAEPGDRFCAGCGHSLAAE